MTTHTNVRSVATGMSTRRTWFGNMGCFSFVGIVATLVLLLGNSYAQTAASWPIYRADSGLSGRAKVEGPIIPDLFWVKQIGLEKIQSPVVTVDNTVIFTSRGDRYVYALNLNGSEKWRFSHKLPNGNFETFSHPPTLGLDGTIYVGSHEGGFFALNPDGSLKWRATVGGTVGLAPNIGKDGNIYLACDDTQIYVFTPSGALLAVASLDGLMPANTPAIVSNAQVYVPAGNSIFVFNSSLARIARWQFSSLGEVAWVVSNAEGSALYAGSAVNPLVIALEAQSGKQLWSYSYEARFGKPSQPALGPDGTIYFAGFDAGLLVALQPNGKEKWTHDQGSARYKTMPVVDASGDIYIVNEALGFAAFAPDKTLLWNLPNVQCKYAPAFGPDGTIYVPSTQKLYAVRHQPPYAVRLEFVSRDSQTACIDSVLAKPIVAKVFDQYGKGFNGQPVRFRVLGSLQDTSVPTDSLGEAKYFWRLDRLLGEQKLEISSEYNNQPLIGSPDTAIAFAVGPKIDGASAVVFDTTAVKKASDTTYVVFNRSDCILTIDSVKIEDDSHPSFFIKSIVPISNILIPPGGSYKIPLQFAPLDSGSHVGTLLVYSNDAANSPKKVTLRGEATTRPEIFVDPTSVPFAEVSVGKDSTKSITIYNVGTAQLDVSALDLSDSIHYKTDPKTPFSVAVSDSRKVRITFTPTEGLQYPATLKIANNDTPVTVTLTGSGKHVPDISVVPAKLVFGKVCLDSCETLALTIFNTGNAPLVVDSIKSTNPAFTIDSTEFTIPPGGSKKVQIGFCPREVKAFAGTLLIYSNDPDSNRFAVPVEGEGVGPEITLEPRPPVLEVCKDEPSRVAVNIKNTSTCAVRIDSVFFDVRTVLLTARSEKVRIAAQDGAIIYPGGSLLVSQSVPPQTKDFQVQIDVYSSAVNGNPVTIIIPGKIKPSVIAAVDTVDFGNVTVGETKTLLDSAKVWAAQCQVEIISANITGVDSSAFQLEPALAYPIALKEGEIANIPVAFHPGKTGPHTAILKVFSNAQNDTIEIVLIGNGIIVAPDIDGKKEASFDSVIVQICEGKSIKADTLSYLIKNVGNGPLEITGLLTSLPFSVISPATPITIAPGASLPVTLAFTPQDSGSFTGTLRITSNDPDSTENPFDVKLSGKGVAQPDIDVPVTIVNFGEVCEASLKPVPVFNRGHDTLRVTNLVFTNPASFSTTHPVSFIIAPCKSDTIWVRFNPSPGQTDSGDLVIHSNDPDKPVVNVPMKGKGGAPNITGAREISFDTVEVQVCAGKNNADTLTYVLRNNGTCDLIVTALRTRPPFAVIAPALPQTIPSGGSLAVTLTFTPQANGSFDDTLFVESNAPQFHVLLHGNGFSQPDIAVVPDTLKFGAVPKDSTAWLPLYVRNEGEQNLVVVEMSFSNPVFATETREFSLKCNDDSTLSISFTPKAAIAYLDTLWIVSNDPDENPKIVILKGNGLPPPPPDIDVSPMTIDFGKLCADSLVEIKVSNLGKSPLLVSNFVLTNPAAFSTTHARSFVVLPGRVDTIRVRFDVTFAKADTGSLCIYSNDPDEPIVYVKLKGEGSAPVISAQGQANFGDVEVQICSGTIMRKPIRHTIDNNGDCPLIISSLSLTVPGAPFRIATSTPLVIPPQGSDDVILIFTPLAPVTFRDTLRVVSNDPKKPLLKIPIQGRGVFLPDIEVTPDTLDFQTVLVGSSKDSSIIILSKGALDLAISGFDFSNPVFSTLAKSFSLACSEDSVVTITFTPADTIEYSGTLSIFSNDPNENPVVVQLNGKGVRRNSRIEIIPKPLQFPNVCLGSDAELCLTVRNTGNRDLNVDSLYVVPAGGVFKSEVVEFNLGIGQQNDTSLCVTFTPLDTLNYEGLLVIISDAPSSPDTVVLIGRGVSPHIAGERSLLFDSTGVGRSDTLRYVVRGDTLCDLRLTSLTISGTNANDFSVFGVSIPPDSTIAPNASLEFFVKFTPSAVGLRTAQLNIESNDKRNNPFVVQLQGPGKPGQLDVTPKPLEALAACVGETTSIEGRLINNGPGDLHIYLPLGLASEGNPPFALVEPELTSKDTVKLRPNEHLAFKIKFTPDSANVFNDELLVRLESANAAPMRIPIKGEALEKGAIIGVIPDLLSFVGPFRKEVRKEVWIKNNGCEPLTIERLVLAAGGEVFSIKTAPAIVTLQPKDSISATVSFKGKTFGRVYNGELLVFSTDTEENSPEHVMLSGVVGNGNNICVTMPDTLKFGDVPVGREPSQPLVVLNCDSSTHILMSIPESVNPEKAFMISPPFLAPVPIYPNVPYPVTVNFKPYAARLFVEELLVEFWNPDSINQRLIKKVVLMGTGTGVTEVTLRPNVVTPNDDKKNDEAVFTFPAELQNVTLHFFDLRGLRVIVLDDRDNSKTIEWNGRDESKQLVLPGPYLWILEAQGRKVKSGQIVVIR